MPKYTLSFVASPEDAKAFLDLAVKALVSSELSELHFVQDKTTDVEIKKAKTTRYRKTHEKGTNGPMVLLNILKDYPKIKRDDLKQRLSALGYSPASVGPFGTPLREAGLLSYDAPYYLLNEKGRVFDGVLEQAR